MARKDRLVWHGDEAMDAINKEMLRRLFAAAIAVEKHAKVLVGKEGAGRRVKAGLNKKGKLKRKVRSARKRAKMLNKVRRAGNKLARRLGRKGKNKPFKGTYRATKRGTLTKRKRPPKRKKG